MENGRHQPPPFDQPHVLFTERQVAKCSASLFLHTSVGLVSFHGLDDQLDPRDHQILVSRVCESSVHPFLPSPYSPAVHTRTQVPQGSASLFLHVSIGGVSFHCLENELYPSALADQSLVVLVWKETYDTLHSTLTCATPYRYMTDYLGLGRLVLAHQHPRGDSPWLHKQLVSLHFARQENDLHLREMLRNTNNLCTTYSATGKGDLAQHTTRVLLERGMVGVRLHQSDNRLQCALVVQ